jgi:hypothetical protein
MTIWIRPSGSEITLNDDAASVAYAEQAGWKRKEDKQKPDVKGKPNK